MAALGKQGASRANIYADKGIDGCRHILDDHQEYNAQKQDMPTMIRLEGMHGVLLRHPRFVLAVPHRAVHIAPNKRRTIMA